MRKCEHAKAAAKALVTHVVIYSLTRPVLKYNQQCSPSSTQAIQSHKGGEI